MPSSEAVVQGLGFRLQRTDPDPRQPPRALALQFLGAPAATWVVQRQQKEASPYTEQSDKAITITPIMCVESFKIAE